MDDVTPLRRLPISQAEFDALPPRYQAELLATLDELDAQAERETRKLQRWARWWGWLPGARGRGTGMGGGGDAGGAFL